MGADLVLVHPPFARACEPTPGVLALLGHLRSRGIDAAGIDANLQVQDSLLSTSSLECSARELRRADASVARVTSAQRAVRKTPAALAALRVAQTYTSANRHSAAVDGLLEGFRAVSGARGFRLTPSDLVHPVLSPLAPEDLLRAARDPGAIHLVAELDAVARRILEQDPRVVGISLVYLSQALPSFALAGALRRQKYRGTLVLGGGLIGSWATVIRPESPLFQAWDVLVAGPGEEALHTLACGRPLDGIPGVMSPRVGLWDPSGRNPGAAVAFDPAPDGLPWERYWAPAPILPLATSRGCYWRRCAFCPEAAQDGQPFRQADPELLRAAILGARDTVGVRWVHLVDNAVPPATLGRLAEGLRGEGVEWYGFARLERSLLDPAFAELLADGGCRMLQLGVETASQRLLDLMGKGTKAADAGIVLRNLARAGIRTYVYLLFGIPTERREEAEATLQWARDHAADISFLNLSIMNLPRGSELDRSPAAFGLAPLPEEDDQLALSLYRGVGPSDPLGRGASRRFLARLKSDPVLRGIVLRTPKGFGSNHAAFTPLA